MYEKACLFLAIVLYGAIVSESRVIFPPIKDGSSGNEEILFSMNPLETETCGPNEAYSDCVNPCNDCQTRNIPCNFLVCNKGCDCRPGYTRNNQRICIPENQCPSGKKLDSPAADDNYNDYDEPDMDDNLPGTKPERFPSGVEGPQENPKENDLIDPFHKDGDELEIGDAGLEESEEEKNDKEYKPEEEKLHEEKNEEEENEIKPDEEKKEEEEDQEKPYEEKEKEELDEEKPDEEKREEEESEEKPDEEKEEEEQEKPDQEEEEEELDEEKPDEERKEEEIEDEEKPDEERKVVEEEKNELESDDDKKSVTEEEPIDDDKEEEKIPKEVDEETDENDSKNKDGIPKEGDADFFRGGSIFDTPFFNLEKVKKYFNKLDRALGHVFQQTMDEAILVNGTYANTTEEEVDIDGKKYVITKSLIKGADNHSSMYIESLSAKPKMNDAEEIKDIEIKNVTQT